MRRRVGTALRLLLAAIPAPGLAAEYVPPPPMPIPTAWQGRAAAVVRILDKLDAHVETLTLRAGETGRYKGVGVTVRSCMDRPEGLPADSAAFLDVQDRHGDVPPFSGWSFAREPAIGVFESPVYGVQLVACDGEAVAPAAPPLPAPPPPPAALSPDDAAAAGSSTSVDGTAPGQPADAPGDGDPGAATAPAPAAPSAPAAAPAAPSPDAGGTEPDPVYPDGPPPPAPAPGPTPEPPPGSSTAPPR